DGGKEDGVYRDGPARSHAGLLPTRDGGSVPDTDSRLGPGVRQGLRRPVGAACSLVGVGPPFARLDDVGAVGDLVGGLHPVPFVDPIRLGLARIDGGEGWYAISVG